MLCTLDHFMQLQSYFRSPMTTFLPHCTNTRPIEKKSFESFIIPNLSQNLKTINGKRRNWLFHMRNFMPKLQQTLKMVCWLHLSSQNRKSSIFLVVCSWQLQKAKCCVHRTPIFCMREVGELPSRFCVLQSISSSSRDKGLLALGFPLVPFLLSWHALPS